MKEKLASICFLMLAELFFDLLKGKDTTIDPSFALSE